MNIDEYVNKWYYTVEGKKYYATDIISFCEDSCFLRSDNFKIIKIIFNIEDKNLFLKKNDLVTNVLGYIKGTSFGNTLKNKNVKGLLFAEYEKEIIGLKNSEFGYVIDLPGYTTLDFFINCPNDEKLFKWYFNKTGGISTRLKIAYFLGVELQNLHNAGFVAIDISPKNILVKGFEQENFTPKINLSCFEKMVSKSMVSKFIGRSKYRDPLLYNSLACNDISSDVYSFAIVIFELLTNLHPFVGDACNSLNEEEVRIQIDSGKLTYIGFEGDNENTNELFYATGLFIPDKMLYLFEKMFIDGKFNKEQRPSLDDFLEAILQSIANITKCKMCNYEVNYIRGLKTCPHCNSRLDIKELNIFETIRFIDSCDNENKKISTKVFESLLKPGINVFSKKLIDNFVSCDNNDRALVIILDNLKKNINIKNCLSNGYINVNGIKVEAGQSKDCSLFNKININIPYSILKNERKEIWEDCFYGNISMDYEIEII